MHTAQGLENQVRKWLLVKLRVWRIQVPGIQ